MARTPVGWFIAFVVAVAVSLSGFPRIAFAILGGVASVLGFLVASNLAQVASGGVEQISRSRWSLPAMANLLYIRVFELAFGAIGVTFLVLALTDNIHSHAN